MTMMIDKRVTISPLAPTVAIWVQPYSILCHADRVKQSFVILTSGTLTLKAERQSARMSKIANEGLTWFGSGSGTTCFIAVPIWQQWASKG